MGLTCVGFIFLAVVLTSSLISQWYFESSQRERVQALQASTMAEAGPPSVHPFDSGAAFIADGGCFDSTCHPLNHQLKKRLMRVKLWFCRPDWAAD